MTRVTARLPSTSPLLSTLALSHLNRPSTPYVRTYVWYVDMMQPLMPLMSNWCFMQLFGWDIESSWKIANQKRCNALVQLSRFRDAVVSYHHMMDMSDEITQASCLDWSTGRSSIILLILQSLRVCHSVFKDECSTLSAANGDTAFDACDYDEAIAFYSAAIDLGCGTFTIFLNRCKANTEKRAWEEVLLDAQKVR